MSGRDECVLCALRRTGASYAFRVVGARAAISVPGLCAGRVCLKRYSCEIVNRVFPPEYLARQNIQEGMIGEKIYGRRCWLSWYAQTWGKRGRQYRRQRERLGNSACR